MRTNQQENLMKTDPKIIQDHPFVSLTVAAMAGAITSGLLLKTLGKVRDKVIDKMFDNAATFNKNRK